MLRDLVFFFFITSRAALFTISREAAQHAVVRVVVRSYVCNCLWDLMIFSVLAAKERVAQRYRNIYV